MTYWLSCNDCHFHEKDKGTPFCSCKEGHDEEHTEHHGCEHGRTMDDLKYAGHEGV